MSDIPVVEFDGPFPPFLDRPNLSLTDAPDNYPQPACGSLKFANWEAFQAVKIIANQPGIRQTHKSYFSACSGELVFSWTDPAGREQIFPTDGFSLRECSPDLCRAWLPMAWTMETFPLGWTLAHLRPWLTWAITTASRTVAEAPEGHSKMLWREPTDVRGLLRHGYLAVDAAGLYGSVSPEPAEPMDNPGALAALRAIERALRPNENSTGEVTTPGRPCRRGRRREYDPDADRVFSEAWDQARTAGVTFSDFCRDRGISSSAGRRTLARLRFRRNRAK